MAGVSRKIKRPVFRIHGGKFKLGPFILDHLPPHRIYVEPFGGGASVLMAKAPTYAEVYNDLDGELVNVFRILRDPWQAEELRRVLMLTPYSREEYTNAYGEKPDSNIEWARKTIIRSFMGYGSSSIFDNEAHGMRTSSSTWGGKGAGITGFRTKRHVPTGFRNDSAKAFRSKGLPTGFRPDSNKSGTTPAHDWASYPDSIYDFVDRLRRVIIENRDAIEVMKQHDGPNTCHYCDPPYVLNTRGRGRTKKGSRLHTYRHELTDEQQEKLCLFLCSLKGYVVLSAYPNEIYDRILGHNRWRCIHRKHYADKAAPRTEALWLNPKAAAWKDTQLGGLVEEIDLTEERAKRARKKA